MAYMAKYVKSSHSVDKMKDFVVNEENGISPNAELCGGSQHTDIFDSGGVIEQNNNDSFNTIDYNFCDDEGEKLGLELIEMGRLTREQLDDIRICFQFFDKNGDKSISSDELADVMQHLGYEPGQIDLQVMMEQVDKDGNGCIDFKEFVQMMSDCYRSLPPDELHEMGVGDEESDWLPRLNSTAPLATKISASDGVAGVSGGGGGGSSCGNNSIVANTEDELLKRVFAVFDSDGDGFIDAKELKRLMADLGESLSDWEVNEMILEADKDGDGRVDFHEFRQVLR